MSITRILRVSAATIADAGLGLLGPAAPSLAGWGTGQASAQTCGGTPLSITASEEFSL
jgi:hypothetical protein